MLQCAMIMSHICIAIKGQTVTLSDTLLHTLLYTLLSKTIKIGVNFVEFMNF